jgi:hypothetical protein
MISHPILSKTKWKSECPDPEAIAQFTSSMRKLSDREHIAQCCGISLDRLSHEWSGPPVPSRDLFLCGPASVGGKLTPKAPYEISRWKTLVRCYCKWHAIEHIAQIVDMWCGLVDAFLACESFQRDASAQFQAWVFGCLAKFVLEQRRKKASLEYDPENPQPI